MFLECDSPCLGRWLKVRGTHSPKPGVVPRMVPHFLVIFSLLPVFGLSHPSSCFSLNPKPFLAASSLFPFPALGWSSSCGFMGAENTNKPAWNVPWSSGGGVNPKNPFGLAPCDTWG